MSWYQQKYTCSSWKNSLLENILTKQHHEEEERGDASETNPSQSSGKVLIRVWTFHRTALNPLLKICNEYYTGEKEISQGSNQEAKGHRDAAGDWEDVYRTSLTWTVHNAGRKTVLKDKSSPKSQESDERMVQSSTFGRNPILTVKHAAGSVAFNVILGLYLKEYCSDVPFCVTQRWRRRWWWWFMNLYSK